MLRLLALFTAMTLCVARCFAQVPTTSLAPKTEKSSIAELIPWLLNENRQLRGIPFSEVIADATGKKVLPFDAKDEVNQRVVKQISAALDEVVKRVNAPARARGRV